MCRFREGFNRVVALSLVLVRQNIDHQVCCTRLSLVHVESVRSKLSVHVSDIIPERCAMRHQGLHKQEFGVRSPYVLRYRFERLESGRIPELVQKSFGLKVDWTNASTPYCLRKSFPSVHRKERSLKPFLYAHIDLEALKLGLNKVLRESSHGLRESVELPEIIEEVSQNGCSQSPRQERASSMWYALRAPLSQLFESYTNCA